MTARSAVTSDMVAPGFVPVPIGRIGGFFRSPEDGDRAARSRPGSPTPAPVRWREQARRDEGEPSVPTIDEVRRDLTGPGGMFEVTTDTVLGRPMQVYANRMPSLRSVLEMAAMRGDDQTFIAYGERSYGFTSFVQTANSVAHALHERFGIAKGDRVAVLSQNNPEWCLTFWATVSQGAILVGLNGWWTNDEI